jgi:hypothetical protein
MEDVKIGEYIRVTYTGKKKVKGIKAKDGCNQHKVEVAE